MEFLDSITLQSLVDEQIARGVEVERPGRRATVPTARVKSVSAHSALAVCRERVYRLILIDSDIPDVNSTVLMRFSDTSMPTTSSCR